ncbi:hypothetical protein ACJJIF_06740 [Microbulbifer sp. SSSA002]|uniref:capsular polysaccharide export protein, LipB/KpsS family n=1 Tax=Microbulbifer sp. SSSA002 TaxID=3243376 RepID=UPI004039A994
MKKILFYEPMPDILRAEQICAIAQQEIKNGNQVFLIVEEEIQLLFRNAQNNPHSICCINIIKSIIADSGIPFFALPRNKALRKLFKSSPRATLKKIQKYRKSAYKDIITGYNPDLITLWNGLVHYQQDFISLTKELNPKQKYCYIEAGWFPQKGTYYQDSKGVNAESSIALTCPPSISAKERETLNHWKKKYHIQRGRYAIKDSGYIFVPLQLETDTNITMFSPFKTMAKFIEWVINNTDEKQKIIIRPHPIHPVIPELETKNIPGRVTFDSETPICKLLAECSAVIGINSTVLLESLIYNKPTYALGNGLFDSSMAIPKQKIDTPLKLSGSKSSKHESDALLYFLLKKQKSIPTFNRSANQTAVPSPYSRLSILTAKLYLSLRRRLSRK